MDSAVFDQVKRDMRIAREEIFGTVLSVLAWSDAEEAVGQADSTVISLIV